MEILTKTLLIGVVVFIIWKLVASLISYIQLVRKFRKIPQKPSHWLFGHGKQVKDSITYGEYVMDVMRGGGRLYCMWNGPFPVLGVCHAETFQQLNKQVSDKARGIADGYRILEKWLGEGLLISNGRKWERTRRLLTPAFHFNILNGYVDVMNDVTDLFLDKLEDVTSKGQSVDIFPYVCRETLDAMLKCSLSYEGSMQDVEQHEYISSIQRVIHIMWSRLVNPLLLFDFIFRKTSLGQEHDRLIKIARTFTGDIIESRRKILKEHPDAIKQKRRLDFLDILLTAKDENGKGLTKQEIQDEVDTFTFEGHDTTSSAISWSIYALGQHPELQEKVYEDVQAVLDDKTKVTQVCISQFKYLPLFIKEVMRFYSPVPMIARKHSKPITIDGMEIPTGPRVDIYIHAIHHNPQVWKNPEEFNPDRFDADHRDETDIYGYIPFSAGARNCIGQVFALNEIKITLAKFVKRFEVIPVKSHTPKLQPDAIMRSLNGLPIQLKKR